ncbi:LUD domain-containing protein [Acerihabitans sp. TG2]|uniref:LutC/YkgG family protein n=1 Tax=Acerihabitans sp. TG2 TaxID=3096008 RepID=UPI002B23B755|nr:LUD domain-containing protein [Acerihabitans sp. TG2]MEA9393518.1 LUD domain-containing protein [Acerihabitans sp. TG2]
MSDREDILHKVSQHQLTPRALPDLPTFAADYQDTPEAFGISLSIMGGVWDNTFLDARPDETTLSNYIHGLFPAGGVFCSAVAGIIGNRALTKDTSPASLEDVEVGIVQARFGVAETGSIWLSEQECRVNTLGYLAQHLVVLLNIRDILPNLHLAYRRPEFLTARYSVLMSGPSATADIEGVLIRGAQGVRSLRVIGLPAV